MAAYNYYLDESSITTDSALSLSSVMLDAPAGKYGVVGISKNNCVLN